jgi:hypothetical protein
MDKKSWQKPELISLTRCNPEEAVLDTCKYTMLSGDPGTNCTGCLEVSNVCEECSRYQES